MYCREEHFWNLPFLMVFGVDLQAMKKAVSFLWQSALLSASLCICRNYVVISEAPFPPEKWALLRPFGNMDLIGYRSDQSSTSCNLHSSDCKVETSGNKIHLRSVLQSFDLESKGAVIQANCICFQWTGMASV